MHIGGYAGVVETARVFHIFIGEEIDGPHHDERGRESGEIFYARRNRTGRNVGRTSGNAKERSPAKAVRCWSPDELAHEWRSLATAAGAVVEHWVDEHLEEDGNFFAVASGDGQHGGMSAAGTFSADGDALGINAERIGVVIEPAERGVIVLQRTRKVRFGREPVVNGNDQAAAVLGHILENGWVGPHEAGFADDVAATMNVQEGRAIFRAGRGIEYDQAQIGCAAGAGDVFFEGLKSWRRQEWLVGRHAGGGENFLSEGHRGKSF